MFFHISLQRVIQLPPKYFGPNLRNTLIEKLHSEVEGTCSGRYGFIVTVTAVEEIGMGKIQHASGAAQFPVSFKAIVFRPFKGEVLDAVVSSVNKMGFMAEVGPLQIFVSKYCMPEGMRYDGESGVPCWVSDAEKIRISKEDEVRLRIIGSRVDATQLFCVGTIDADYLGLIS